MAYSKAYTRIVWVNESDGKITPLGAINLNRMDYGISVLDDRIVELSTVKADQSTVLNLVSGFSLNKETGVITITKLNGEQILFDLNIEKIPVSFSLSEDGILTMTTEDGTVFSADIGNMIPVLEFESSDEISVNISGEGSNKTYSFSIKNGSIKSEKLQPNFLADVTVQAQNASKSEANALSSENNSKQYAENASGYADTAKSEADRAEEAADRAEAVSGVGIATEGIAGLMAGGDNAVSEDGTLMLTKTTTDRTLLKSHAGGLKVNRIDGESQQKQYSGENLWSLGDVSGTLNSSRGFNLDAGTYTISSLVTSDDTDATQCLIQITCEDGTKTSVYFDRNSRKSKNITITSKTVTFNFYASTDYTKSDGDTFAFKDIQIEEGSTATDYEPYVGNQPSPNPIYPQEIESVEVGEIKGNSSQLLDRTSMVNGADYYTNDGTITSDAYIAVTEISAYPSTNYTVSAGTGGDYVRVVFLDYKGRFIKRVLCPIDSVTKFTTPENCRKMQIAMNTATKEVMFTIGDEPLPYEPYTEKKITLSKPIILRGIGDVKDVLCKQDGVYGVLRKLGKWIMTGTETWSKSGSRTGAFYISPTRIGEATGYGTAKLSAEFLCSHATYVDISKYSVGHCSFDTSDNTYSFWFTEEDRTLDAFKTWIAENNVTVDYLLATPTFEPLPTADQIALHQLETFDTVTYISTDSEIEPVIEVEYGTSNVGAYALRGMNATEVDKLTVPVTNLTATVAGKPLDATMGKALFDYIQENALPMGVATKSGSGALAWDYSSFSEALLKVQYAGSEVSKYVSSFVLKSVGATLESVSFYTYGNDSLVTILLEINQGGVSILKAKEWFLDTSSGSMSVTDILAGNINFTAYLKPPVTTYT